MGVKVRERPKNSGIWWLYIDHAGRRKAKKIGENKPLAKKIAKEIEAKLILKETGILDESPRIPAPTLKEIAYQWLEVQVKPSKRISTYNRYKGLLNMYVAPQIGSIKITELKRMYVLKVLRHMLHKNLSRSSIEQAKNVISGIAEFAIDLEELNINPTHGAMKRLGLKRQPSSNSIVIFTKKEIFLLLETCKTYRPDFYFLFLTAFRTGLRLGEILALKWENVNWKESYIVVDSSWRNGHLDSTKTGKNRNVDLSDQLVAELSKLLKKRKEEALRLGTNEIVPIIFHTHQEYTSQNSVRNVWKKVLAKAGLDYRKFHSTRHTFASLLIAGNHPLNYIKEMLGHHSIQMTVDTYGHLIPNESNTAVNSLDDATIRNLSATTKKETLVTNEDYEGIIDMVAMQGIEPRTLRI